MSHGAGTKLALPDAARDPNAARAAAVQAAQDAGESFSGAASTYDPFKPGWKSGGPETASGDPDSGNPVHSRSPDKTTGPETLARWQDRLWPWIRSRIH